jgi:hypothetical protein
MVAIQNIVLIAAAAGSSLVSASCWSVTLKVRGVNNVWERGMSPLFISTLAKSSNKYL